jgi:hypothetical protein
VWRLLPNGSPVADEQRRKLFPTQNRVFSFPRALALFPLTPGGSLTQAAVVLRLPNPDNEYRLNLIDLRPQRFGTVTGGTSLWKGSDNLAVLAVSPDGRYLAVAGNTNHEIRTYAIADLRQNKAQPQTLRGSGVTVTSVTFVKKDQEVGLALKGPKLEDEETGPLNLVFNLTQRKLTGDQNGWRTDEPTIGVTVKRAVRQTEKGPRPVIVVLRGDTEEGRVELKENHIVTAVAPLPAQPPSRTRLLAVAYLDELRQPWLNLYNPLSGELIRQCTGHVAPIGHLACSGDGRLLASAALDQVVCVWSLTDLDKVANQRGMLRGVAVESGPNGLIVAEIDKSELHARNQGKVLQGQIIKGLVRGGQLQPLATPRAFYDAIWAIKPGQTVTLRLADPAGKQPDAEVPLVVGQGADEQKPLFSLFIDRRGKPEEHAWIAWNPNGPYETNAPQTEQRLGWHFNPAKTGAAPSFARAAEYHQQYYKEGLLKHLVARGNLTGALEDLKKETESQKRPEPRMSLWIREAAAPPLEITDRAVVRRPHQLMLAINNFPPDQLETARWRFDSSPWAQFDQATGRERSADLTELNWKRGPHQIRVELRTRESIPQVFTQVLEIGYLPPPPVIRFDPDWLKPLVGNKRVNEILPLRLEARDARFRLRATVFPGLAGQNVVVHLQWGNQREQVGVDIDRIFDMQAGETPITIEALNEGASGENEPLERVSRTLVVTFLPSKAPLQLTLEGVVVPTSGAVLPVVPGKAVVVETASVRVHGRIAAEDELDEAMRDQQRLSGFKPGAANVAIDEPLTLRPGLQTFQFATKTKGGKTSQALLTLVYRPLPPRLELTEPSQGLVVTEGRDQPHVQIKGRLIPRDGASPFQAAITVNGKQVGRPVINSETLTADVPLDPGENRIEVRLTNEWHGTPTVQQTLVTYRRPPRIVELENPTIGPKPLIDLVARVESPSDLPLTGAEVNGRKLPPDSLTVQKVAVQVATWKVVATGVPLERGENAIQVVVRNADGPCLKPATLEDIVFSPEPPAKAVVGFEDPQRDMTVKTPRYRVRFHVQSVSPLQRVEMLQNGRVVATVNGKDVARNAEGGYEVRHALLLDLRPGANPLQLTAVNDGGRQTAGVTVTYTPVPVQVVIDKLEWKDKPGQWIFPQEQDEQHSVFPAVAEGRVRLHGHVTWLDANDKQLKETIWVRLRVNGFLQLPTALAPHEGSKPERAFHVDLTLNRPRDNQITLAIPQLKAEDASCRQCSVVECGRPVQGQRLRLLIVGIGQLNKKNLSEQALEAFHAKPDPSRPGRFTAPPAFAEVIIPDILTGYVTAGQVYDVVQQIKEAIETPEPVDATGALNDVVMLYYQGQETINQAGHFLWTSDSRRETDLQWTAISCDALARVFADTPGAQVMLLDVVRQRPVVQAKDTILQWCSSQDSPVGAFRCAWEGSGAVPDDAHLLTAWKGALAHVGKLGDLDRVLTGTFAQVSRRYLQEMFKDYVPPEAAGLRVGGTP